VRWALRLNRAGVVPTSRTKVPVEVGPGRGTGFGGDIGRWVAAVLQWLGSAPRSESFG